MTTLRLTQFVLSPDRFRVEAALEDAGVRQIASSEFALPITSQDGEDLRWYLEDYLEHVIDPAPKIASRIEQRIAEIGSELFKAVFQSSEDGRDLWAMLRDRLSDTRVELVTGVAEAAAVPWELLRDPKTDTPVALRAKSFVRVAQQAQHPRLIPTGDGPIRILLVICRPGGREDVPFRSVASRLIKSLTKNAREAFQLDVLRPPTFEQLSKVLHAAKHTGAPYHVVHFDGHGTFEQISEYGGYGALKRAVHTLLLSPMRSGSHGYLLFENPRLEENVQLVDGTALGKLLVETGVSMLVLNACRSAHAEPPTAPNPTFDGAGAINDVHAQTRAFGSLAQEVIDAGLAGVVAMRYNVYVVTAAQFVADLYESLAAGRSLGEAVALGRKQLEAQPLREIAYHPVLLQDWMVPIVYETQPVVLFPSSTQRTAVKITISADATAPVSGALASEIETRPDAGFFGRDETLLALDRALDTQSIVLLHAFAGSGKTSTAAEFARWYRLTGGLDGPVLFTSFERHKPLVHVLNESIGRVFDDLLQQSGIHWFTLADDKRREVALLLLAAIPVLWVWDNVEPIAGFPSGTPSAWSAVEQQALRDFLQVSAQTKAKFILTSRRDERDWLGDLPARIRVPPMPMQERVQLARALSEKHGKRLSEPEDWLPLLRFTRGNPLTVTVLVGQALRDGLTTKTKIEQFVDRLRTGEAAFDDEASEGRDRSLAASLSYGFEHAFEDDERKQLALLHFFQGYVDVDALVAMANPKTTWALEEISDINRDVGIALLDRASEIGLLTALGDGYYSIHPALPWFFSSLFQHYYSANGPEKVLAATKAFVGAIGALGDYYLHRYNEGSAVVGYLNAEESNLLHAYRLALTHGLWSALGGTMQGLQVLYDHTGQRSAWAKLVAEVEPDLVDSTTDGPPPGREDLWSVITSYRVHLALDARDWSAAERLQRMNLAWQEQTAGSALQIAPDALNNVQRQGINNLAVSKDLLGRIQREQSDPACIASYQEALALVQRIGERHAEMVVSFNLGKAYENVSAIRDLNEAERWYRRSLEMTDDGDRHARAKSTSQLGSIALGRFKEARAAKRPDKEILEYLNASLKLYLEALELDPPDAFEDLASDHNDLANVYAEAGDLRNALAHWRESLRLKEQQGDLHGAATTRFNIALTFARHGRFADAREYAYAALRNLETFGNHAAADIQKTRNLIADIEKDLESAQ